MNWRGRPLTSHEVVVQTIAATTTRTGLTVHAELDPGSYPTGQSVTDGEMATLALAPHHWHGAMELHPAPAARRPHPATARAIRANMDRAIRARPRLAIPPHADRHDRARLHASS